MNIKMLIIAVLFLPVMIPVNKNTNVLHVSFKDQFEITAIVFRHSFIPKEHFVTFSLTTQLLDVIRVSFCIKFLLLCSFFPAISQCVYFYV